MCPVTEIRLGIRVYGIIARCRFKWQFVTLLRAFVSVHQPQMCLRSSSSAVLNGSDDGSSWLGKSREGERGLHYNSLRSLITVVMASLGSTVDDNNNNIQLQLDREEVGGEYSDRSFGFTFNG